MQKAAKNNALCCFFGSIINLLDATCRDFRQRLIFSLYVVTSIAFLFILLFIATYERSSVMPNQRSFLLFGLQNYL